MLSRILLRIPFFCVRHDQKIFGNDLAPVGGRLYLEKKGPAPFSLCEKHLRFNV